MRPTTAQFGWIFAVVAVSSLVATVARGDVGPNFNTRSTLTVWSEDPQLADARLTIAVLDCSPQFRGEEITKITGFEDVDLPPLRDCRWLMILESAVGRPHRNFAPLAQNTPIRLAIRLHDSRRVFVSNELPPHPVYASYIVRLRTDGSAELLFDNQRAPSIGWLVSVWQQGLPTALLLTCGIELAILAVWSYGRRCKSKRRILLTSLFANVATVTGVWLVTLSGFALSHNVWFGLTLLIFTEIGAFVLEGTFYLATNQLRFKDAFLASLTANAASFLTGVAVSYL